MKTEPVPAYLSDSPQPSLLIYDGNCRLCVAAKDGLDRAGLGAPDSGVRMIPYDSQEAISVLGEQYRPGPPAMAYFIHPAGAVSQGLEAFLPLLSGLPGGRVIRSLFRWPPAKWLAGRVYGLIARHRYRLFGAVTPPVR